MAPHPMRVVPAQAGTPFSMRSSLSNDADLHANLGSRLRGNDVLELIIWFD
jgi:hypothetical protein